MDILSYVLGKESAGGGGGTGLVYETGTFTPTANTTDPTIYFENQHSKAPFFVLLMDGTNNYNSENNKSYGFCLIDYHKLGMEVYKSSNTFYSAAVVQQQRWFNSEDLGTQIKVCPYNSDNEGASSEEYTRYWVDNTAFYPHAYSTNQPYIKGRTYKWIAVWK